MLPAPPEPVMARDISHEFTEAMAENYPEKSACMREIKKGRHGMLAASQYWNAVYLP
jgi:hypothetical protein